MIRVFIIITLQLLFMPLTIKCEKQNESKVLANTFLYDHFKKKIKDASKIVILTKDNFLFYLLETSDSSKALKEINKWWPYDYNEFYDSIYFYDDNLNIKAFVDFFGGDTLLYTLGFFNNGKKDSTWINVDYIRRKIKHYKNGKLNGLVQSFYKNGQKLYECNFEMNTPVDTMFEWYPNGTLREFEVWKNGKSIHYECFDKEGNKIMCEDD